MSIMNDDTVPGFRINPKPGFEWPVDSKRLLIGYRMVRDKLTTLGRAKRRPRLNTGFYLGGYNINDSLPLVEVLP